MATSTAKSRGDGRAEHVSRIRARLNRIEDQVNDIERMYDDGHPCLEILDLVAAARCGLDDIGLLILRDHVRGCLEPVVYDSDIEAGATRLLLAVRRFVRSG
jgi:DNA-binding FrmR family transcriptional regulator